MMQPEMERHKIKIGRDGIYEIVYKNGLQLRKRRRRIQTTDSKHNGEVYMNMIENREAKRANEIWVSDITYIKIGRSYGYLSLITDAYSRKILGYKLSETLATSSTIVALEMAIKGLKRGEEPIHHSDRGVQYSSREYIKILQEYGIKISMSRPGHPSENGIAERVNGIIKNEYLRGKNLKDIVEAEHAVQSAVRLYNEERPHLSCGMQTPKEAHRGRGELQEDISIDYEENFTGPLPFLWFSCILKLPFLQNMFHLVRLSPNNQFHPK